MSTQEMNKPQVKENHGFTSTEIQSVITVFRENIVKLSEVRPKDKATGQDHRTRPQNKATGLEHSKYYSTRPQDKNTGLEHSTRPQG